MDAEQPPDLTDEEGGDPVCWAHLVCPECGAIVTEGHRAGCQAIPPRHHVARDSVPDVRRNH
jgi:hypothetical protein